MYVGTRALQVCQVGVKVHWEFVSILFQIIYGPGKTVNEDECKMLTTYSVNGPMCDSSVYLFSQFIPFQF